MKKNNLPKKYPFENLELDDMDGEIWSDINGYDGMYQVSSLGRVKSVSRYDSRGNLRTTRILKQCANRKTKSMHIGLSRNAKREYFLISELVGFAFLGEKQNSECYSFGDNDYKNCTAQNLKIITLSENVVNKFHAGIMKPWGGKEKPIGNVYKMKQTYIALKRGKEVSEFTYKDIVDKYGKGGYSFILAFINKKKFGKYVPKSCYGFQWKTKQIANE